MVWKLDGLGEYGVLAALFRSRCAGRADFRGRSGGRERQQGLVVSKSVGVEGGPGVEPGAVEQLAAE